jgi:hypothetical protein
LKCYKGPGAACFYSNFSSTFVGLNFYRGVLTLYFAVLKLAAKDSWFDRNIASWCLNIDPETSQENTEKIIEEFNDLIYRWQNYFAADRPSPWPLPPHRVTTFKQEGLRNMTGTKKPKIAEIEAYCIAGLVDKINRYSPTVSSFGWEFDRSPENGLTTKVKITIEEI